MKANTQTDAKTAPTDVFGDTNRQRFQTQVIQIKDIGSHIESVLCCVHKTRIFRNFHLERSTVTRSRNHGQLRMLAHWALQLHDSFAVVGDNNVVHYCECSVIRWWVSLRAPQTDAAFDGGDAVFGLAAQSYHLCLAHIGTAHISRRSRPHPRRLQRAEGCHHQRHRQHGH